MPVGQGKTGMTRQNHKRGFNLIEAAIVLAVVGLVIGGIWVAAANVSEKNKLNRTTGFVLSLAQAIDNHALTSRMSSAVGDNTEITELVIQMGLVPQDWLNQSGGITTPWGHSVYVFLDNNVGFTDDGGAISLQIIIADVPSDICKRTLREVLSKSTRFSDSSFLWAAGTDSHLYSRIAELSQTSNFCAAGNQDIVFFFHTR